MAVKIYIKGNFLHYIDSSNLFFADKVENILLSKETSSSNSYSLSMQGINKLVNPIAFADIRDEAGSSYASQSAFETYIYEGTGIRVASGGGSGATNLGYTASPTNGIVTSDTGTDATIPLADVTNAGLLSPSEKTKISNSVPYTGATSDVDLGANNFNAQAIHVKGTGGNGHLGLRKQTSTPSASANESSIYADTNGNFGWKNDSLFATIFQSHTNTADRTYTLRDRNGILVDDTDLATKQNALGYTAENQANKENTTLDTSSTKYPTNNLVKTNIDLKLDKSNSVLSTYLEIPQQANPSTPTSALRLFADSSNRFSWIGSNGFVRTFDGTGNTASRVYSLPDSSGTIALTSNLSTYAPLASPSLTGNPTAPTQSNGDNSTKIATTAYVANALSASGISSLIPTYSPHETFRGVEYANNSTTETTYGGITISTTGSATARSVATTNYATRQIRKGFVASVVSSGRYTGTRGSALLFYVSGGFRYVCDVYISDTAYASGCRQFYGMMGQTTDLTYSDTVLVDTMVNVIGFGSDSADTNINVFHNDATGTCTKIDLGSSFPANRSAGSALTAMYSFQLYNDYSSNVWYKATNNETGVSVEGVLTTNLPLTTQGLNFVASRCMGGGGGITNSGQFDLGKLGVYSL